jgi:hypothetical protein
MPAMLRHRTTFIWLVLVVATSASWVLASECRGQFSAGTGTAVMLVAFVKVRLVGLHFMELRSAPVALRTLFEAYVVVVFTVVVAMYLAG